MRLYVEKARMNEYIPVEKRETRVGVNPLDIHFLINQLKRKLHSFKKLNF